MFTTYSILILCTTDDEIFENNLEVDYLLKLHLETFTLTLSLE